MFKELDKFKTGKKINISNSNKVGDEVYLEQYSTPLGDLLVDFIKHIKKPFWKRKTYHNELTKQYVELLNDITVISNHKI